MKHYKKVDIPAATVTRLDFTACDICGNKIDECAGYGVDEVEIYHKDGVICPDGGYGDETNIDMCGKCFEEKLVPWVESFGGKVSRSAWNY